MKSNETENVECHWNRMQKLEEIKNVDNETKIGGN